MDTGRALDSHISDRALKLHNAWRGFTAERVKAKKQLSEQVEANNARIAELRETNIRLQAEFDDTWRQKKEQLQKDRDEAVMEDLAKGFSAQRILRELGSNNSVWIYELRGRVEAAGRIPQPGNVNTLTHGVPVETPDTTAMQVVQVMPDVRWLHHNHQGVVGWLLSEDHNYVKKYGTEGTDLEGEWFICDRNHLFIGGNLALYQATPKSEVVKRTNLLEKLLDGTYEGRIKEVDNPYAA